MTTPTGQAWGVCAPGVAATANMPGTRGIKAYPSPLTALPISQSLSAVKAAFGAGWYLHGHGLLQKTCLIVFTFFRWFSVNFECERAFRH